MAGARGPTRRQLVARGHARRRRASFAVDPALARRVAGWLASACAVAVVLGVAVPWIAELARHHPYFALREVALRHRGELEPEAVRALAGVDVGSSIWDVDVDVVQTRLLTNGWIRTATVRRELPDRVVLHVREHRPVAILAVADETPGLYYLAQNGRIFAPVAAGDPRDLPFVTGLTRKDLAGDGAFGPRAVRRALALMRHAARQPAVGTISELHVDRELGLTLMPIKPALPITIGWGEYDLKLARVAEVLPFWSGREGDVRDVSCLFEDDVVVRTRTRVGETAAVATKKVAAKKTTTKPGSPAAPGTKPGTKSVSPAARKRAPGAVQNKGRGAGKPAVGA
jgi:cell division protein FtsQ